MANRKQISYGSRGSDVSELQRLLNQNGYTLTEDGIFGQKTLAAVKDYQKKNGLTVDGIVGPNTWGLFGTGTDEEEKDDGWEYGDKTKEAKEEWDKRKEEKPGDYESGYQDQLDSLLDQIVNRKDFTYDLNGDALYQQYKDQYTTMGNMAMMDTMGQAAAMTGGYGSSYAQTAGQQAYQGYLQNLNNKVPELYQLALDAYNREGQELRDMYDMYLDLDEKDYGRHRDKVGDWERDVGMAEEEFWDWYDREYGQDRDKVADEQWEKEYNYRTSSKSSGGGGGSDKKKDYTPKVTKQTIMSDLDEYIRNGASKSDINNYLRAAYQDGYITQEEYLELKEQYAPRGTTY